MFSCFFPDECVESTYEINFEKLYEEGYRGLIFDIDNTLVPHGAPADERAVALFLDRRIKYLEIVDIIEACMDNAVFVENPSVDEILQTEQCAYDYISKRW